MTARFRLVTMFVGVVLATTGGLSAQVELDRILSRVNGKIVTRSDVRQAQLLKLVDEVGSEASTQRALENRLLLLGELSRASSALPPATSAELDARRHEWEASLGGAANVTRLLAQTGMSAADLDTWLRDDLRIQAYLRRQYGTIPEPDRTRAINDGLARLRQRAGLD
jgi:hypothetical protein